MLCGVVGASAFAAQLLGDSLKTVHWTVFALQCRAAPYLGEGVAENAAGGWSVGKAFPSLMIIYSCNSSCVP